MVTDTVGTIHDTHALVHSVAPERVAIAGFCGKT